MVTKLLLPSEQGLKLRIDMGRDLIAQVTKSVLPSEQGLKPKRHCPIDQ